MFDRLTLFGAGILFFVTKCNPGKLTLRGIKEMKNIKASSNAMLQFITPELISKFNFRYLSIFNGNTFALFHSYNVIPSTLNLLNYRFACGQRTSKYMLYYMHVAFIFFGVSLSWMLPQ